MSKAREIAEERFAKGEITVDEYKSILDALAPKQEKKVLPKDDDLDVDAYLQPDSAKKVIGKAKKEAKSSSMTNVLWFLGIGVIAFLYFNNNNNNQGAANSDLAIGSLSYQRGSFSVNIANKSSHAGDAIIWASESTEMLCARIVEMEPHSSYDITIRCLDVVGSDGFTAKTRWATKDEKLVTTRLE